MGRDCGYLALVSSLTSGAELCLIPELDYDLDSVKKRLTREIAQGREYCIAVVAEGVHNSEAISKWFRDEIHMDSRVTVLGHIQRGGSPTVMDRLMGFEFSQYAVDKLKNEPNFAGVVVYKDSKFDFVSIDYVNSAKYQIDSKLLDMAKKLTV